MSFLWRAQREQNYRTRCEGELAFEILGIPTNTSTDIKPYDPDQARERYERLLMENGARNYHELAEKVANRRLKRAKKILGGQI